MLIDKTETNLYLNFVGKMRNINRRNGKYSSTEANLFERVEENIKYSSND